MRPRSTGAPLRSLPTPFRTRPALPRPLHGLLPGLLVGLFPLAAADAAALQDDPDAEPVPDYLQDAADDPYAQDLGMAPDPAPAGADGDAPDADEAALPTQSLAVPTLSSPGMPRVLRTQTSRFTSLFNPAIGFSLDGLLDYEDVSGGEAGLDLTLRTAEMTAQAWIDPAWWGYLAIAAEEDEILLEEAAAHYVGFSQNTTVRVGKMYVDFGKQMQVHIHDLLTPERPAVLAAYLGEELAGTGVQLDHWWPVGESTAVRVSGAVFADLTQQHAHGHEEEEVEEGAEAFAPERKDLDQLAYTARLTGMTDVGTNSQLQLGLSWRGLPGFGFAAEDDMGGVVAAEDLSNQVYGTDLTFGWASDDGTRSWTTGFEYLVMDGDLSAELDAPMTGLDITSGSRGGWYGYVDHEFDRFTSAGVMVSEFEHLEAEAPSDFESTVYFTRYMSEFSRLRFALTHVDSGEGPDAWRALVQFTAFLGPHGHPYNW